MVLERTAATMFYKTYEKEGSSWLAASLVLFALMLAFVIPLAYFVVKVKFFMVIGIIALLDCAGILSVSLLFWSNKFMRRLKFISQIILTQRYQITENLRILHIIIPLIIVGTIFDFIALAGSSLQTMLDFNTQLYYPFYYGISNLYVSIAFGLLLKYNEKSRKRISTLLFNKYQSSVEPELGNITNVDGQQIVINETVDIHFNQLAFSWK